MGVEFCSTVVFSKKNKVKIRKGFIEGIGEVNFVTFKSSVIYSLGSCILCNISKGDLKVILIKDLTITKLKSNRPAYYIKYTAMF